jgi:hypothetical protein
MGPFYGDYGLRGRLNHNRFNILLCLKQSITSTKPLVTMVSKLDAQVRIQVHHKGDIGFKDKRHGYYYQWFY